ncbi:glucosamine-6-phosphate isomerase [Spirochaetia bacterium]|nr:glucosamine-6-phosphate isomerase [Spirochaetia bacterium]
MNEKIFASENEMGEVIADEICALVRDKKNPLICLAAGHSSLPVFRALVERKKHGFDFAPYYFVAMDEWAGMNSGDRESCGGFLEKNLLTPLAFPPEHTRLFDGRAADLQAECEAVEQFIERQGGIDFMLLGIGMNGHLALNEPGCNPESGAHVTELSDTTKNVGQKYFSNPCQLSGGLTLGLKNIKAVLSIIVNVTGAHKAPVVKKLRVSPAGDMDFPASALKALPQVRFFFDTGAAGL